MDLWLIDEDFRSKLSKIWGDVEIFVTYQAVLGFEFVNLLFI